MKAAVKKHWPEISRFFDKYKFDDANSDIQQLISIIKAEYANKKVQEDAMKKMMAIFTGVDDANATEFSAEIRDAIGVDIFQNDPWLENMRGLWSHENAEAYTNMQDKYTNRLGQIISDGVRNGDTLKNVAGQLQNLDRISEKDALFLARDQVATLNGQLTRARQLTAGITQYKWQTCEDERVRPEHKARDGKIFSWTDPPDDGAPGEPYLCRCTALPVIDTKTLIVGGIPTGQVETIHGFMQNYKKGMFA